MWRRFFDGTVQPRALFIALAATLVAAWIVSRFARRLATAGLRAMLHDTVATSSPHVRAPLRIISATAFALAAAVLLFPAFELAGLKPRTGVHLRDLSDWTFDAGLKIVLIVFLAYATVRITALVVRRFEHEMSLGTDLDALERGKRARTVGSVIQNVTTALVVGIAMLMVLHLLDLDITPVLTGAGIAGLAVGFGAQTLVRDIISGFFLILEDQVRVGDVAAINGTPGLVEAINLRTIVLRDVEGTVHVFPNGAINTLANRTKEYSYYVVDIALSYDEDTDRVAAVLKNVGEQLQADDRFGPLILEPLEVMGVDAFADWWVTLKARIKTVPQKQWEVGRELRRRILKAFEEHRIDMPVPALRPVSASIPPRPPLPASGPATPGRS
jgi:moderate conductance mechanosensitive channel